MKTKQDYLNLIATRNTTVATIMAFRLSSTKKKRKKKELSLNELVMKTPKDELPALLKEMGFL